MAKIGLYLCECGPNIADAIDLDRVAAEIEKDGKVAGIERHKLFCSADGKKFLAESIKKNGFERFVIAACSPKQHEGTFAEVASSVGLNPQLFQLVNIREQCAWTVPDKEQATGKALRFIRAAVSRVQYHQTLEQKEIDCNPDVIVIGGGIAGIEAALRTAHEGRKVFLAEKGELGGMLKERGLLFPAMEPAGDFLGPRIDALRSNPQIEVFENCKVKEVLGFFGSFVALLETQEGKEVELKAGSVVLATGAQSFDPKELAEYGHGKLDGVYTADEIETAGVSKLMAESAKPVKSIAIVHCVGRDKLGHCSRMCCVNSMKIARQIREQSAETEVVELYRDLCLPGKAYDRFYKETEASGIRFARFESIEVTGGDSGLTVKYKQPGGTEAELAVDMVVLSTGLAPNPLNPELADMLSISVDESGFFAEEHVVLNPVSTMTEGVFIAGCARGPGDIRDTIVQASATAGKVLSSLVPGKRLQLEIRTSEVSEKLCVGCGTCVTVCAYGATTLDESRHIAVVNEVLCRGCGNCASACPSGAAKHRHFTTRQLNQEVTEILK